MHLINSNPLWTTTPFSRQDKILRNCTKLHHGKTWWSAKDLDQGGNKDAWRKLQRSARREKKEMEITLLNHQKNAWEFFCHMDYCKDELCKVSSPMEKLKLNAQFGIAGFGLLQAVTSNGPIYLGASFPFTWNRCIPFRGETRR